jgi:TPR repeat protein
MRLPAQAAVPAPIAQPARAAQKLATMPPAAGVAPAPGRADPADVAQRFAAATPKTPVTPLLVGLNVLVFVLLSLDTQSLFTFPAPKMIAWGADFGPLTITDHQWWRLMSNCFLHLSVLHLACNMYALLIGGLVAERMFGNGFFLLIYLGCGLAGSLASLWANPAVVAAGASGAVFGLFGAVLGYLLCQRQSLPRSVVTPLAKCAVIFIAWNLLGGLLSSVNHRMDEDLNALTQALHQTNAVAQAAQRPSPVIDWAAHLGGLLSGFLFGFVAARPLEANQRRALAPARALLLSLCITATAALLVIPLLGAERRGPATLRLLAGLYFKGEGVRKSPETTAFWLKKAAEQSDLSAAIALASLYYRGESVPKDIEESMKWFRQAADQGDLGSQLALAKSYYSGEDMPKNVTEAVKWLTKAAEQGDAKSQRLLGALYYKGDELARDMDQAIQWWTKAGEQGDLDVQKCLAAIYYQGDGVPKDPAQALEWLRKAGQQGDLKSQTALAQMYDHGEIVTADKAEAAKWYGKAAGQGDAASQYALGLMYARGDGVELDKVQALKWLVLSGTKRPEAQAARRALEQDMTEDQKKQAARRAQEFLQLRARSTPAQSERP